MHRWFFADEAEACDAMAAPVTSPAASTSRSSTSITERPWTFCVLMNQELCANELLAVVGNTNSLGNWQPQNSPVMARIEDSNYWQVTVNIPRERPTEYRYFVCALDQTAEKVIVRRWETHLRPRLIPVMAEEDPYCKEIFGSLEGKERVDRGWLTSETLLQLKFFHAPFTWKQRMKRRLLYVKVTPMNLKIPSAGDSMAPHSFSAFEDSLSSDTHDTRENGDLSTAFAFNEVVTLRIDECEIKRQPQFGTACGKDDLVIFHLTLGDFESTAYLIDLYTYSSEAAKDEPPYHLGYHYVLPNLFKHSEGLLEVPITCASRHRPLGMMKIGYLIIKPVSSLAMDMRVSYSRYWNHKWKGLDVGHRGSGTSFKTNESVIRENTIYSLKNAADHGADYVEFDVQLSKDLVPVVYHDFMIYVSMKTKNAKHGNNYVELPLHGMTLEQLKTLKIYHVVEGRSKSKRCFENDDLQERQPCPPLADVLDAIDPHVGFNIEIKWSQRQEDGTMEEGYEHVVDKNLYLDCILDVVFRKAGSRRIVFSCFDPDTCTMLRFKQNRYPVMFLTLGGKHLKFMDPRGRTIETAVFNALAMELLGIVAHTEDLLRDPSQVNLAKERNLILFCWGEENNSKETIKLLKNMGLHAIIYDKMDSLSSKEVKKSVFQLEAEEGQKELLQIQALEMSKCKPEIMTQSY